jgi:hypothetical protein
LLSPATSALWICYICADISAFHDSQATTSFLHRARPPASPRLRLDLDIESDWAGRRARFRASRRWLGFKVTKSTKNDHLLDNDPYRRV